MSPGLTPPLRIRSTAWSWDSTHDGRALEGQQRLVDAGRLDHAAALGEVAVEDRQAAFGRVGVLDVVDAALRPVEVERLPALRLREGGRRAPAAGGGVEQLDRLLGGARAADVPGAEPLVHARGVDGPDRLVEQAAAPQLAEDRRDAARPVHVLHQVLAARRDLADAGHAARELVDVVHREVDLGLLRGGEQVEDRVGRAAHRDVERHRVLERLAGRDRARQDALVVLARSSAPRSPPSSGRRPRTAPAAPCASPGSSRCRAGRGRAPRSGSSSSWR